MKGRIFVVLDEFSEEIEVMRALADFKFNEERMEWRRKHNGNLFEFTEWLTAKRLARGVGAEMFWL